MKGLRLTKIDLLQRQRFALRGRRQDEDKIDIAMVSQRNIAGIQGKHLQASIETGSA